ncbi:MAG TPA: acyltransferase [Rhizomicrobium sp.]|nr:acyltransferase [Rhizomicrobium sp.]
MRFRALDGWRGFCALLVALHHMGVMGWIYYQPLIRHAWMFVDFFFVLSGFVIAFAYGDRLGTSAAARSFVIRRFGRLWPLHAAMLAVLIALEFVHLAVQHIHPLPGDPGAFIGGRSIFAIVTNLFLLQDFGLHDVLTWNTPSWSISAEFFTYLVFAAVCLIAPARWTRIVLALILSVLAATILLRVSDYGMRETFHWGFVRCVFGFFAGVITYEIWRSGVAAVLGGSITEIAAVLAVIVFIAYRHGDPRLEYLSVPLFALTVLIFAGERGLISQLMLTRPVAAIGRWSYSIYMVHIFVIAIVFSALHVAEAEFHMGWMVRRPAGGFAINVGAGPANDLIMLGMLAAVVAFSALTYRYIELPGQRWAARVAARHPVEMSAQIP